MKKSKYQQYFNSFIVCIQDPYSFWFNFYFFTFIFKKFDSIRKMGSAKQ